MLLVAFVSPSNDLEYGEIEGRVVARAPFPQRLAVCYQVTL